MDEVNKFEEERQEILAMVRNGIQTNIPMKKTQKRYLKNLLLFSLMRASKNPTVTKPNFVKLVAKQFKKYIVKIIHGSVKNMPNHNPYEDEDFYDENLDVEINRVIANEQFLNMSLIQQSLTPKNIIGQIRTLADGLSAQEVIQRITALKEINSNHRETPEEERKRQQRIRDYERQRQMQNMRFLELERGSRERH